MRYEKTAEKDFLNFSVKGTKLETAVCDFKFWLQYFFFYVSSIDLAKISIKSCLNFFFAFM